MCVVGGEKKKARAASISIWAVAQQTRAHLGTLPSQKKKPWVHLLEEKYYSILRKRYKCFVYEILLIFSYDTQGLMSAQIFSTRCWIQISLSATPRRR